MLHHLLRILAMAMTAAVLAGGSAAAATTAPIQPAIPAIVESQPAPDTSSQNAGGVQPVMVDTVDLAHKPPEELPLWLRFSGIVGHIMVIAFIIAVVTWVQKLITWLSAKPKTGM